MRTTRTPQVLAYAFSASFLLATAGCAGGGSRGLVPPQTQAEAPATVDAIPRVRFTIVVRKSRKRKHGHYVSPSTKSATIAVGAAKPVAVNLTPSSAGCTKTLPLTCSVTLFVPAGNDTFAVTLYDALDGAGKQLSTGVATATVAKGAITHVGITLNGIVASLQVRLSSPSPIEGSPSTIPLGVSALDADGNTILTPGNYENAISITDSDTSHTQIQLGSATPGSSVTVSAPGQSVSVLYDGNHLSSATFTASVKGVASVTPVTAVLSPVAAQIVVNAAEGGTPISQDVLGANLPAWTDNTSAYMAPAMSTAGLHLVRWPGGSLADDFHWNSTSICNGGYADSNSTFDSMMNDVAIPANLEVAITVNYGSNLACTGGGDPLEAASWVAYAKTQGYGNVKYWTVGNEDYGSWETDLHASPHDPTTYANAMSGSNGYYVKMRAANPAARVGVVVAGPSSSYTSWDPIVLTNASYDYVEYHYYAQGGIPYGQPESDSYLLDEGVTDFANALIALRTEMTNNNVPASKPIYLGELNSVVSTAGKQTVSITNGLFAGMAMAEVMKQPGVTMATWWLAFGDCQTAASVPPANLSPALYGFQNFGAYTLFSDQSSGCGSENTVPAGTAFPDGQAYHILSQFAGQGSVIQNVTTALSTTGVRAYADTLGSGYGVLLFNLNENAPATYTVELGNATQSSFTASQTTYGKAQYDLSQNNVWSGPVTNSLGTLQRGFSVTLPPWSMNLVTLVPVGLDRKHRPRR